MESKSKETPKFGEDSTISDLVENTQTTITNSITLLRAAIKTDNISAENLKALTALSTQTVKAAHQAACADEVRIGEFYRDNLLAVFGAIEAQLPPKLSRGETWSDLVLGPLSFINEVPQRLVAEMLLQFFGNMADEHGGITTEAKKLAIELAETLRPDHARTLFDFAHRVRYESERG